MSEELPTKRSQKQPGANPAKKAKKPLISESDWQPYAEILKSLEWEDDEDGAAKRDIACKLASPEGLQEIIDQLQQKVPDSTSPPEEIPNIAQYIQNLFNQVFPSS